MRSARQYHGIAEVGGDMKRKRIGELFGAIIGDIIAIVLVNSMLVWRQWTNGVVLESWIGILWAANLSLTIQIVGNLILIFYRPQPMVAFMRMIFSAASLVSMIVFFMVFPVDFSAIGAAWLNTTLKVILAVAMGAACLSLIVNLVRLMTGRWHD
jgi:hypothetical protein